MLIFLIILVKKIHTIIITHRENEDMIKVVFWKATRRNKMENKNF